MASRGNVTQFLITCRSCKECFSNSRKPFLLNCQPGHRMCEVCLENPTKRLCPTCRKPISNRVSFSKSGTSQVGTTRNTQYTSSDAIKVLKKIGFFAKFHHKDRIFTTFNRIFLSFSEKSKKKCG